MAACAGTHPACAVARAVRAQRSDSLLPVCQYAACPSCVATRVLYRSSTPCVCRASPALAPVLPSLLPASRCYLNADGKSAAAQVTPSVYASLCGGPALPLRMLGCESVLPRVSACARVPARVPRCQDAHHAFFFFGLLLPELVCAISTTGGVAACPRARSLAY